MGLGRVPAGEAFYAQVLPTCDCRPTGTALGSTPRCTTNIIPVEKAR